MHMWDRNVVYDIKQNICVYIILIYYNFIYFKELRSYI